MQTRFEEIVQVENIGRYGPLDLAPIAIKAAKEKLVASSEDAEKVMFLGIDIQKSFLEANNKAFQEFIENGGNTEDFQEVGSLAVKGSLNDVENIVRFLYRYLDKISTVALSKDLHTEKQIFHPAWWANEAGNHPAPYTVITARDIIMGKWRPLYVIKSTSESLKYVLDLEKHGKQLIIWPLHCLKDTEGQTIENELTKMVYFHSVSRSSKTIIMNKGTNPLAEMYGIVRTEDSRDKYRNKTILDAVLRHDRIFVGGEAASHCVPVSVEQIIEELIAIDKNIGSRITILTDCTSPVCGYEKYSKDEFSRLHNQYGVNLAKSTDVVL